MTKVLVVLIAALCIPTLAHALPTDAAIRQTLQHRIEKQHWATGIVVGITSPEGHRIVAYGTTTKDGTYKVDGNTIYDVGSLTKVFTALALTDMATHGEVALGDPAAKYLPPGTKLPQDGARQITLADLATHTSGLPLRPSNLVPGNPDNKYAGYTAALLYQFLAGTTLPHGIGTYDYSNVGFGLLGDALAHRANMPYRELIASRILTPLHLNDTRFTPTPDMQRREAQGYSIDLRPLPHWDMGALESAGGLRSTANDVLTFLDAALGRTPSPLAPAFAAMTQTRRPGGMQPATAIALAWNIYTDKDREIVWKNGNVGGYRAFMGYDTKAQIGVVALANVVTGTGADDIGLNILDPSIPIDLHVPSVHTEVAIDPALLDRYVGHYKFGPTDILAVTRDGDHLYVQPAPNMDKLEVFPESSRDFFLKITDAQVTFETAADGTVKAAIWHQDGQDQRGLRLP